VGIRKLSNIGGWTSKNIYTSFLAGNTKFDNWVDTVNAGSAGFFRSSNTDIKGFDFSTDGTYNTFGDLATPVSVGGSGASGGLCNSTRYIMNGGYQQSTGNPMSAISYRDIATRGNGLSFGSLTAAVYAGAAFNNSTRGISYAGYLNANIDYVTIATLGNGTSFGSARQPDYINGGCSNTTRGTSWGSQYGGQGIYIDYVTIATTGNYTNFGQMSQISNSVTCGASTTRGCAAGINSTSVSTCTNEYITFASTGNSASFGTLTTKRSSTMGSAKASTNFVVFGGYDGSAALTSCEKWAIASGGAATSWGTLSTAMYAASGGTTSNCHGGN
jgi:hypothetical protein